MTPVIHQTDFFRPHEDPDDHWDLACTYGLAERGLLDLRGIVVDYPPAHQVGNPDACSIAQLNYMTGRAVPFATGHAPHYRSLARDSEPSGAERLILDILGTSPEPVAIQVAGSARDVAAAVRSAPDLFEQNCRGIYLNAGTGETPGRLEIELEYNVRLDQEAYRSLFDAPCPLYWAPCFERLGVDEWTVAEHGAWWKFLQSDIMDGMSSRLKNYFLYMFDKVDSTAWLAWLEKAVDPPLYHRFANQERNMWCTASFFHSAGQTVESDGSIVPIDSAGSPVFEFVPINVACDERFLTTWEHDESSTGRFMLRIRDVEHYAGAMTAALKKVILTVS